jgi:HD-like signal output (HDOD) protein
VENQKQNPGMSFFESETALGYGVISHQELGAFFLDLWNLPDVMVVIALFHHNPEGAAGRFRELVDIVSFTDRLVEQAEGSNGEEEVQIPEAYADFVPAAELKEVIRRIQEEVRDQNRQKV